MGVGKVGKMGKVVVVTDFGFLDGGGKRWVWR